jgi:hypothetical protein
VAIRIVPTVKPPPSIILKRKVASPPSSTNDELVASPPSPTKNELAWSLLEATGEIRSKGPSLDTAIGQGASYTVYLLQARPDLVSVVGIFIHPDNFEFQLFFTDAWGVCCTDPVKFTSTRAKPLLVAWIRHLYEPECRSMITREGSFPDKPTFTIAAGHPRDFTECHLLNVGSPFHRRSTIFKVSETPPLQTSLIIKSQYLENSRRFEEGSILDTIHGNGDFPGVVRILPVTAAQGPATVEPGSDASASHGSVVNVAEKATVTQMNDEEQEQEQDVSSAQERETTARVSATWPGNRRGSKETRETLIVLRDTGAPLMDAETALDALIAIYDLLEGNIPSLFLVQTLIP